MCVCSDPFSMACPVHSNHNSDPAHMKQDSESKSDERSLKENSSADSLKGKAEISQGKLIEKRVKIIQFVYVHYWYTQSGMRI